MKKTIKNKIGTELSLSDLLLCGIVFENLDLQGCNNLKEAIKAIDDALGNIGGGSGSITRFGIEDNTDDPDTLDREFNSTNGSLFLGYINSSAPNKSTQIDFRSDYAGLFYEDDDNNYSGEVNVGAESAKVSTQNLNTSSTAEFITFFNQSTFEVKAQIASDDWITLTSGENSFYGTYDKVTSDLDTKDILVYDYSDGGKLYRISTSDLASALGDGYSLPALTAGSVLFSDGTDIAQDNANFFWDNTNNRLGILTASPETSLQTLGGFAVGGITNSGNVQILPAANVGRVKRIILDQPNMQQTFAFGNADGAGGISRPSENFGELRLFSNRATFGGNPQSSMSFFTNALKRMEISDDGHLTIGAYTLPTVDGTSGQVLETNGSGVVTWQTISGAGAGTTTHALTINNGGAGDSSGFTFDGSAGKTISYNSIGAVPTGRVLNTTAPLAGGGDLSADRTLTIVNAVANGSTKGAATFTAADFNDDGSGLISIDYVNGQVADATHKGFLTLTDWNTFNGKQATLVSATNIKTINGTSILGAGDLAVQATLVSTTNIKTVNGSTLLGAGDLSTAPDESYQSIAFASSLSVSLATKRNFLIGALTGNLTVTLTSPIAGKDYKFRFIQGGAGSFTVTFPAGTKMPSGDGTGNVMNLTTTVGAEDWVNLWYDGTNYRVSLAPNFV